MASMTLSDYLKAERGRTNTLAALLGVSGSLVTQWANGNKGVSAERAVEIERATAGTVTRRDLRPADWFKVWPELVDSEHPTPAEAA